MTNMRVDKARELEALNSPASVFILIVLGAVIGAGAGLQIARSIGLEVADPLTFALAGGIPGVLSGTLASLLALPRNQDLEIPMVASAAVAAAIGATIVAYSRSSVAGFMTGVLIFTLLHSLGIVALRRSVTAG